MDEQTSVALAILDNVEALLLGQTSLVDLGLDSETITINYSLYDTLVDGLSRQGRNLQQTLPAILTHIDDKCILPGKISNLTRKVRNFINKNSEKPECLQQPIQSLHSPTLFICDDLTGNGITVEGLLSGILPERDTPCKLENKHILCLRRVVQQKHAGWKLAVSWLVNLLCLDQQPNEHSVRSQWNSIHSKFIKFTTSGKKEALSVFMSTQYEIPGLSQPTSNISSDTCDAEDQARTVHILRINLTKAYEDLSQCSKIMHDIVNENAGLAQQTSEFEQMKQKFKKKQTEIAQLKIKLASVSTKNVNRRLKRKEERIQNLTKDILVEQSKVNDATQETDQYKAELQELRINLGDIKRQKQNEQKAKHYWKIRAKISVSNEEDMGEKTIDTQQELSDRVRSVENENLELKELVQDLITNSTEEEAVKLRLFKDGKYADSIRIVYMDLLRLGVSIEHCQSVVRSVLKNLLDVEVDRLPKKSLASILSVEAQIISQAQVAEAMLKNTNSTLYLDGTNFFFKEYAGFQISTEAGSFSMGLQLMAAGDTDSYLDATRETLKELSMAVTHDEDEQKEIHAQLLLSIQNVMTDRHIVNKCYKPRLEEEKFNLSQYAGGKWDKMSAEQRQSICTLNGLYCGLHILPNMATTAINGMKEFEKKVNCLRPPSGFKSDNSVGYDFIYQVAKAFISTSGDQKSGDALDFGDFLHELNEKCRVITFLHNRFNVLFHDGGAVYYQREHIKEFLTSGRSSKNNRLLNTIRETVDNPHVLSECRALGIIGKLIAVPLWNLLEDKSLGYFEMNKHWLTLTTEMETFCKDASPLLEGKTIFNVPVKKDVVYDSLLTPSEELDTLTKLALQNICSAISPMLCRQLKDQLPDGLFFEPSEELIKQTKSAPLTNRISEADFSDLDRMEKCAPQKGRIGKSGLICYTRNKTSTFLQKLSLKKRKKYLDIARKTAINRMKTDRERSNEIRRKRLAMQRERMKRKQQREAKQKEDLVKLEKRMESVGIWVTKQEVQEKMSAFTTKKERLQSVKEQIKFHVIILKTPLSDKSLGKFQKGHHFFLN